MSNQVSYDYKDVRKLNKNTLSKYRSIIIPRLLMENNGNVLGMIR